MAYAVENFDGCYYLTLDGNWLTDHRSWGDYSPEIGDPVTVVGRVSRRTDVRGEPFLCIEPESVLPQTDDAPTMDRLRPP